MEAPIFVDQLELTEPITAIRLPPRTDGEKYQGVQLLVRMQRTPVGHVFLAPDDLSAPVILARVWDAVGTVVNERRARAGLAALGGIPVGGIPVAEELSFQPKHRPFISVVVSTRDRSKSLVRVLRDLAALRYSPFEVVVVDNAPSSDETRKLVLGDFGEDQRFRYVREPSPGLSYARNRGVLEASGDIVAFADDDVRVDPWWLDGIMKGFQAAPDVSCVTGMIATAEIDNAAQLYFHIRAGWGVNCEARVFDLFENRDDSPLYPYTVGRVGAGANFAITRMAMKEIGGFDVALGAGSPAGGGEDLNFFMRVILNGHCLVYEPSAIVWHVHRSDLAALSKQIRTYGSGCTAAMTAIMMQSPRARVELPTKVLKGIAHMIKLQDGVRANETLPSGLVKGEGIGIITGPWLYLKGRRNMKRLTRS